MADANQLKIQARREEAAGDYEEASRLYLEALSAMDDGGDLSDPSLLVRVADLEYRQDDRESALDYYLMAVDEYAEQGLITNAIAVCNKILRVFPDQVDCHRRLADLHMDVGLAAEARQNLLRFTAEAWDPDAPEEVLEAMRTFLERTPDQEVALELASRLQEVGREQEALDALESVWSERTRAGADVEALKRKAETIHSEAAVEAWSDASAGADDAAVGDPAAVDPSAGAGDARELSRPAAAAVDGPSDDTGARSGPEHGLDNGRDAWSGGFARRGPVDEPRREFARGGRPAGPARELDLVASYRERFIEVRRPPDGEDTDPSDRAASVAQGDAAGPETPRPEDETPANGAGPALPEAAAGEDPRADHEMSEPPTPGTPESVDESAESHSRSREEEIMEELNELDRASEVGEPDASDREPDASDREPDASDAGAWSADDLPTLDSEPGAPDAEAGRARDAAAGAGDPATGPAPDAAATPPADEPSSGDVDGGGARVPPTDEDLGEEAELRRGLELVDEMLEVQPENLELRERKLRYARRMGDRETLAEASLDFADALAKDGARRSARALYRRVLELDPDNQAAESGLARLDVGELEEKRQSGKRAGAAHATPGAASPEEQEARRELGMRLWTEFENSIREMPWLHAATQAYQATGPDARPPLETFEMLAHYLVARGRYRDAAEILERALELVGEGDEDVADVLYYLGRAHEKLGEEERAEEYYRRLERVDPDFARVRATLGDDRGAGS